MRVALLIQNRFAPQVSYKWGHFYFGLQGQSELDFPRVKLSAVKDLLPDLVNEHSRNPNLILDGLSQKYNIQF